MKMQLTLKNQANEQALFHNRMLFLSLCIFLFACLLIARLLHLQLIEGELYRTLSIRNQLTIVPIAPRRGLIFDRDGVLLADNVTSNNLQIIPNKTSDLHKTLTIIKSIIPVTPEEEANFWKTLKRKQRFEPIVLKSRLTEKEVAQLMVNKWRLPSTLISATLSRYYPYANSFAHAVGFVGRINDKEFSALNPSVYSATNYIGKVGIEKYYENLLHGRVGYQQLETDANGRVVRIVKRKQHTSGNDLYLTIDSGLQAEAEKALGNNRGAVVAINPQNGEILAFVSNPSYDPNIFVHGISNKDYQKLRNAPYHPLYNRVIRGAYPFASTIKVFYALQALDLGIIHPADTISDPGYYMIPGNSHVYKDWKKHGTVNMEKAIVISCDTYFYRLAMRMGIKTMGNILLRFGFGHETGVDMGEELGGVVGSPAWKRERFGEAWYGGDTVVAGIGQGFMTTTPLQLAWAAATISMHGVRYRPHLLKQIRTTDGELHPIHPDQAPPVVLNDPEHWNFIIHAMKNVVQWGTAARIRSNEYTIAGKTGTAQVFRKKSEGARDESDLPEHLRNHSLFMAFAPVENPQIAIGIVGENNKNLAKTVAKKVLDYYILGKTA